PTGNLHCPPQYKDVRIWAPWGHIAGRWYGNRTDRPILALHGWMDNLGTFDELIPLLPDYLGILCVDLPGHGLTGCLPPGMHYSADDWLLVIGRVMKEYKWSKVSLLGHSLGGVLSFIHTALAPQTVDMVIALDIGMPPFEKPQSLKKMAVQMEKHLVEEDRNKEHETREPPSYTMDELRHGLSRGTYNSVPLEFAHCLLKRAVSRSQLYPDKFYFARDGRTKFHTLLPMTPELAANLARCIKDKPYLIIKGSDSPFIDSDSEEALAILAEQNPHFEFHEVEGLHHVHLSNAAACARFIVPFLRRHRPPPVGSWSMAEKDEHGKAAKK
ncbi:hypothetical protein KR222_000600, partial [Zaprionus bogoriensis]